MKDHRLGPVVVAMCFLIGWLSVAAAQDRLSDAAKGLSLDHPESEQVLVIEPAGDSSAGRIGITGAEAVSLAEQALALGRTAEAILGETRSGDVFYEASWRDRMIDACIDLENSKKSLQLLRPPQRYVDEFDGVVAGAAQYASAAGSMRRAIANDEPLYGGVFKAFDAAGRATLAAVVELRLENDREGSEQTAPSLNPFAAKQAYQGLCRERYPEGRGAGFDSCMSRQAAAVDAMRARVGFSVGLDEATFNSIRRHCAGEWPKDMVARDRCELSRADAARR